MTATQPDTRPLRTSAPDDVQRIGIAAQGELMALLTRVVAEIVALPGSPAERENDALSVASLLAAFAAKQFVGELMLRRNMSPTGALSLARGDLDERLVDMLNLALAGRGTVQ